jgi:hypothetical protein
MYQRSKKPKSVKVCPFVPLHVRTNSEAEVRRRRKTDIRVTTPKVQAEWLVGGHDIATAKTPADALAAAEKLYGKPLLPPAGGVT